LAPASDAVVTVPGPMNAAVTIAAGPIVLSFDINPLDDFTSFWFVVELFLKLIVNLPKILVWLNILQLVCQRYHAR
jgi:hypothetical protein